ncbi:uncharacterized protein LOC106670110 isoform X2 [Cimex lectularius]|uniref:Uncharacterized protein n=1 Tax=Cimex lectularius TaxID=79782 RepID=A0A8I6S250_CIMLE|nr:uncharacterized protein LOC106670110 isoform X2 [Cimex lectularius]
MRLKNKKLPDALKLIEDIKVLLKPLDISHKLKDYVILRMLFELTNLIKTYSEIAAYFRKELCLLRLAIKNFDQNGEMGIRVEAENLKNRLDRVISWKMAILRKGQEVLGSQRKLLLCCIDDGIRIVVTEKPINIVYKMSEARNLKNKMVNLLKTADQVYKPQVTSIVDGIVTILSLDGLSALKLNEDLLNLAAMIKNKSERQHITALMNGILESIPFLYSVAAIKRDDTEKALNDIYRTMLYLDRQADLYSKPHAYLPPPKGATN